MFVVTSKCFVDVSMKTVHGCVPIDAIGVLAANWKGLGHGRHLLLCHDFLGHMSPM